MRTDLDPQAMLAACLGIPLADFRRVAPYVWRQVPIRVTGARPARVGDLETGVWFTAGDPVVVIVGVLPDQVVVGAPTGRRADGDQISYYLGGLGSHVRLSRTDPDLPRLVPRVIATIANRRRGGSLPNPGV